MLIDNENNHYCSLIIYQDILHRADQRLTSGVHQYSQLLFNTNSVPDMVIQHINALSDMKSNVGNKRLEGDTGLKSAGEKSQNIKYINACAGMFPVLACLSVCHLVCASASSRALIMRPRLCAYTHTYTRLASHISLTQCLTVPLTNQWHQTLACGSLIPVNVLLCNS